MRMSFWDAPLRPSEKMPTRRFRGALLCSSTSSASSFATGLSAGSASSCRMPVKLGIRSTWRCSNCAGDRKTRSTCRCCSSGRSAFTTPLMMRVPHSHILALLNGLRRMYAVGARQRSSRSGTGCLPCCSSPSNGRSVLRRTSSTTGGAFGSRKLWCLRRVGATTSSLASSCTSLGAGRGRLCRVGITLRSGWSARIGTRALTMPT